MKNPPAFPIQHQIIDANDTNFKLGNSGMSLRDYFAAKAMQGELSAQSEESGFYDDFHILAKRCYDIADAMLKARGE